MTRWPAKFSFILLTSAPMLVSAQRSTDVETVQHKAWYMLQTAATAKHTGERANGVRALGLLPGNARARKLAEDALHDPKAQVRASAATALGQMHATESVAKLQQALNDREIPVVLAVAHSLKELKDSEPADSVYYELLTGERKTNDGFIAQQMATMKDPKQLAMIGFSEGIGFVPFASIGWDAWRTTHKKDPNPVRAVAASYLAHDPDPNTAQALLDATRDNNWIVRAAAVEALAKRGETSVLPRLALCLYDKEQKVRFSAAAAVIHLDSIKQDSVSKKKQRSEQEANVIHSE